MAANRNFASGGRIYSMHKMPVLIDTRFELGASGSVSSVSGAMVQSVEHVSTGVYKIHLQNSYQALYLAVAAPQSASAALSGILGIEVQNAPDASVGDPSDPSLTIKCLNAAGALADPAAGSAITCLIYLRNATKILDNE